MKFLVDAQLPRRLALALVKAGHDALHTFDLPDGNRTTDLAICETADREGRVVMTKDQDFVTSFLLAGRPERLLLVSTGNIKNTDLESIVLSVLPSIVTAFDSHRYVELTRDRLIVHA